jgi:hypothetical protein
MIGRAVVATGDPAKIDELVAFTRDEIQPVVDGLPGSHGLGMWVNRKTGDVVVSTAWQDEAALKASDERLAPLRAEALRRFGSAEPRIEILEPVLIWQRDPSQVGQWTRAAEVRHPVDRLVENLASFKEHTLPAILEFPGVSTVALMANRTTGLTVLNVAYATDAEFEASRDRAATLRSESMARLGASVERVTEMQVAIAGIRPPIDLPAQGKAVEFPANADT